MSYAPLMDHLVSRGVKPEDLWATPECQRTHAPVWNESTRPAFYGMTGYPDDRIECPTCSVIGSPSLLWQD